MNEWLCLAKKSKRVFNNMLISHGYSEKVVGELWKWYNPPDMEDVASFWNAFLQKHNEQIFLPNRKTARRHHIPKNIDNYI